MIHQRIFVLGLALIFQIHLFAQEITSGNNLSQKGSLTVHQSPQIDAAIERFKKYNYSSAGIDGFRIQIYSESGNDAKAKADKVLADYTAKFKAPAAYLTYQQPNFKVRCGDFRTKSEARKYVKMISTLFPSAFIVKDEIQVEK